MSSPPPEASPAPTLPPSPPAGTPTTNLTSSPPPPTASGTPVLPRPPPLPPLQPRPPQNGNMPAGTLAALIVGIGIGIVFSAVGIFVIVNRRRKRDRDQGIENIFGGPKDDAFTGRPQHWQQNAPPPTDNKVKMLLKPTTPPGIASNPQQLPVPRAPPSMSSSLGSEKPPPSPSPGMALGFSQSTFTYEELAMATNGFSDANLLGQGGFGYVHKGVLPNGRVVAIKQLKAGSGQGEREFQAEVEIISRVHHKHLVSLVGYCITGAQRMLVYEFVPNNTLEYHLHEKGRPTMNWPTRMRIALGSAKGLAYLHEDCHPKIIHRDIKASNILVDYNFETMVADFGLAKFSLDTETHISTRVMGTFGYLAPEYASSGKLTDKSDVFSFGVVLLELITGRRPIDRNHSFVDDSMVDWARPLLSQVLQDGNFDTLIDPRLQKDYNSSEVTRMVACAAACVRHSARHRPRMSQIVRALEGNISLDDLHEGIRPGHSTVYSNYGSSDYDTSQYKIDVEKFRKVALESQEGTSLGSVPTSEYSMHQSSSSSGGQQTTQERGTSEGSGPTSEISLLQSSSSSGRQQNTREMELEKTDKDTKDLGKSS